jgi:hypothetical protein
MRINRKRKRNERKERAKESSERKRRVSARKNRAAKSIVRRQPPTATPLPISIKRPPPITISFAFYSSPPLPPSLPASRTHARINVAHGPSGTCQWYMQKRIPNRLVMMLVKPWLQCLMILWGISCSLSRINDNRHHWWDVLCGVIIGLGFGVFVVRVFCKQFEGTAGDVEVGTTAKAALSPMCYANAKKRNQSVNLGTCPRPGLLELDTRPLVDAALLNTIERERESERESE